MQSALHQAAEKHGNCDEKKETDLYICSLKAGINMSYIYFLAGLFIGYQVGKNGFTVPTMSPPEGPLIDVTDGGVNVAGYPFIKIRKTPTPEPPPPSSQGGWWGSNKDKDK